MEELERAKDRLLYAPCGADARQCLMFQVLGRRRGEADRRDGCSSAAYGIRIFFQALQECTRPERHSVGRVLSAQDIGILRRSPKYQSRLLMRAAPKGFASLRTAAFFRASISFFRELLLSTRPHLAQPLPASAVLAESSTLLSRLGVTVAASQRCSGMRDVSKRRCAACARFDPCAC